MQFELKPYAVPEKIKFNYEELRKELLDSTEMYKTLFYTDDQMKKAKEDRSRLNHLKKALNDERIRIQKEYMEPFGEFKSKIDDLISIIGQASAAIDTQIREFEQNEKEEKRKQISDLFDQEGFQPFVSLNMIWNEKWLNKTCSLKQIGEDLASWKHKIGNHVATISSLPDGDIAMEYYKKTLDIDTAISRAQEHAQLQKKREEAEKARAELEKAAEEARQQQEQAMEGTESTGAPEPPAEEPEKKWARFEAYMTMDDAIELVRFFKVRGIEYRNVR